jgi:transcriptional regulator with XRE-family HTH domain
MNSKTRKILKLLKKRRKDEGLSLRALSELTGVSFSTLSRLEKDNQKTEPDPNTMARILNWLGDEAEKAGVSYKESALVHFRAKKNASPETIESLLEVASLIKKQYGR